MTKAQTKTTTKKLTTPLDRLRPMQVLTMSFSLLMIALGLTLGIVIFNQNQDNRSQASGNQPSVTAGCNQTCKTNSDCDINLRCYYGVCRLAINPTDETCRPSQPTTMITPTLQVTTTGTAQISQTPEENQPSHPKPNEATNPTLKPQPTGTSQLTAISLSLLADPNYRLPLILLGLGLFLILLAFTIRHKAPNPKSPKQHRTHPTPTPSKHQLTKVKSVSSMTQRLKQKQVNQP